MPKRGKSCDLEFIAKKLRKLEKEVKRSRREKHTGFPLSSSSSSSSSNESSGHRSSRDSSPDAEENLNRQEITTIPSPQPQANATGSPPLVENSEATHEDVAASSIPNQPENQVEPETSAEILDMLGVDPSVTLEYGADINKDVATRLAHISTTGLNKDLRKELVNKFLIPANCTNIAAPLLNPEIKAALTEPVLKRDKAMETRQKQIAAGITHLGKIISDQLSCKEINNTLIKDLMDVSRIFCDIQYSESEARRNFALYSVKKDLKDQLFTTKIDKYLFGTNLPETLKTAKAVSKSSTDLKPDPPKKPKGPTPSTSSQKNLNWKARTQARRQPPVQPPRHQPPATSSAPPAPRGSSSQGYAQRQKQARRR